MQYRKNTEIQKGYTTTQCGIDPLIYRDLFNEAFILLNQGSKTAQD